MEHEQALGQAIERAAELLPEDWHVRIDIEQGGHLVWLLNDDGCHVQYGNGETIVDSINECVDKAVELAAGLEERS